MTTPAFDQFGLRAELVQTAAELGFTHPTTDVFTTFVAPTPF